MRRFEKGHLGFVLHGERLTGGWDLIRMGKEGKKENWLLIKKNDDAARPDGASAKFLDKETLSVKTGRSMDEIAVGCARADEKGNEKASQCAKGPSEQVLPEVELATLVDRPPAATNGFTKSNLTAIGFWLSPPMAACVSSRATATTGRRNSRGFMPSMAKLKAKTAVLDMEAVVLDAAGKSSFQAMQQALGEGGERKQSKRLFSIFFISTARICDGNRSRSAKRRWKNF